MVKYTLKYKNYKKTNRRPGKKEIVNSHDSPHYQKLNALELDDFDDDYIDEISRQVPLLSLLLL